MQPDGHVLLIGGDDSWRLPAKELRRDVFGAMGLSVPPEKAFRPNQDPTDNAGWFYECWMDVSHGEQLLGFQRVTHDAFMGELRKRHRGQRIVLSPLRPLASRALTIASPYTGRNAIEPGPTIWDDICRVFDVPENVARTRSSMPPPAPPFPTASGSVAI